MAEANGAAQMFSYGKCLRELGLEQSERAEVLEVAKLLRHDGAVSCLLQDQHVHDPDDPRFVEPDELRGAFTGEVLSACRELDDEVVDGPELVERSVSHERPPVRPRGPVQSPDVLPISRPMLPSKLLPSNPMTMYSSGPSVILCLLLTRAHLPAARALTPRGYPDPRS
jgi:hypothetical protein